ncbi:MAG: zinc ribbon domain-containing protein [Desulfovibrio sp.]|nr:zinc ribbon domain-containing protein [Desulfovibrio sp.]
MPIYEYKCPTCQKVFEEWVHLSEMHDAVPCPDCGAASPRIMSETSFVLKGGGWYVTDYGYRKGVKEDGSASDAKDAKAETASGGASNAKTGADGAKAEAKPAAQAKPAASAAPQAKPAPAAPSAPKASAGA